MASTNPFTVLGFAQSAFRGLSDQNIRHLVKAQYRALAQLHHPDSGGNTEKFKEVQEAYSRIEEDFEFEFHKKMFMRKRKDQVAELKKENRQASAEVAELHQGLVEFWIAYCRGQETLQRPSFGLGRYSNDMMGLGGFSIFNPPPLSIIMMDRLKELMRKQAAEQRRQAKVALKIAGDFDPGCFNFRISPEGVMTRQELVKTYFDAREKWRPSVRKEWVELRTNPPTKSYYWKPEGEPEVITGSLIGSFPPKVLSDNRVQKNSEVAGLIPTEVTQDDYRILERGYSLGEFEPYLRYIRPQVTSGHLVIIAEGDDERSIRFKILGYARKILTPEEEVRVS